MAKRGGPVGVLNGNWKHWWKRQQDLISDPLPADHVYSRYWHVERKTRNGWRHVQYIQATKQEMARIWIDNFMDGQHRLRHQFSYAPRVAEQ